MFALAHVLELHTADVKDILLRPGFRATCSRDGTVKVLSKDRHHHTLSPGCGYVNCLAVTPSLGLYAGCQDGTIVFYETTSSEPARLAGHSSNVCALDYRTRLLSGSWDHTLKEWRSTDVVFSYTHPGSVWACRYVSDTSFASACADARIRIFRSHVLHAELLFHLHCVRGLWMHGDMYSVSNEGLFVQSRLGGDLVRYSSHGVFMYSVYADDEFVVLSGEEGTVVVNGQEHRLPAQTVWRAVMWDGQVYAAGSDGKVYVLQGGDEGTEGGALGEGSEDNAVERSLQASEERPRQDEETKNLRKKVVNGKVYVLVNNRWVLFGDVVQKFDHTVNVDVEGRSLKLSFNADENPFDVANRFVAQHKLSEEYRDDIIGFIKKNFRTKEPLHVYDGLNYAGIEKILERHGGEVVLECLRNPSQGDAKAVEACLAELMRIDEQFAILDCYRYLVAKGFAFDFAFLTRLRPRNRKEALVFVKLLTNLHARPPFNLECLRPQIDAIKDTGMVSRDVIDVYERNRELSRRSPGFN